MINHRGSRFPPAVVVCPPSPGEGRAAGCRPGAPDGLNYFSSLSGAHLPACRSSIMRSGSGQFRFRFGDLVGRGMHAIVTLVYQWQRTHMPPRLGGYSGLWTGVKCGTAAGW